MQTKKHDYFVQHLIVLKKDCIVQKKRSRLHRIFDSALISSSSIFMSVKVMTKQNDTPQLVTRNVNFILSGQIESVLLNMYFARFCFWLNNLSRDTDYEIDLVNCFDTVQCSEPKIMLDSYRCVNTTDCGVSLLHSAFKGACLTTGVCMNIFKNIANRIFSSIYKFFEKLKLQY